MAARRSVSRSRRRRTAVLAIRLAARVSLTSLPPAASRAAACREPFLGEF